MSSLLRPASVAVVGATDRPGKMGSLIAQRLADAFTGDLHFVHPTLRDLHSRPVHERLADVPGHVDLVVAVCPADRLLEALDDCPPGKAEYLLAIPGGFGEAGDPGVARQRQLLDAARRCGLRVVGPNTAGLLNTRLGLNASLLPDMPATGPGASFVTQSGGFAMSVLMYSQNHQLPVTAICDVGNTADVGIHDVLEELAGDDATTVIGLFLESIEDPTRFETALRMAAAIKPIVLTRRATSAAGDRVTRAHLGRAPGPAVSPSVSGVRHAATAAHLLGLVKALCWQPALPGGRVAIVTGTGGIGSELTDLCVDAGLEVLRLSDTMQERLAAVPGLPAYAPRNNPVDLTPVWWDFPTIYPDVIGHLLDSEEVDGVLVAIQDIPTQDAQVSTAIVDALGKRSDDKPVVVFWGSTYANLPHMRPLEAAQVPCYTTTLEAVQALAGTAAAE
jgi:acetyltransferase